MTSLTFPSLDRMGLIFINQSSFTHTHTHTFKILKRIKIKMIKYTRSSGSLFGADTWRGDRAAVASSQAASPRQPSQPGAAGDGPVSFLTRDQLLPSTGLAPEDAVGAVGPSLPWGRNGLGTETRGPALAPPGSCGRELPVRSLHKHRVSLDSETANYPVASIRPLQSRVADALLLNGEPCGVWNTH